VPEARPRSRLSRLGIPALAATTAAAICVVLQRRVVTATVQPDKLGYLGLARFIVGSGPRPGTPYFPGYSIVIAPAALFAHSASQLRDAALATNAILVGCTVVLAVLLARRVPSLERPYRGSGFISPSPRNEAMAQGRRRAYRPRYGRSLGSCGPA